MHTRFMVGKPERKKPLGRHTDMRIMLAWLLPVPAVLRNAARAKWESMIHRLSWALRAGGALSGPRVEHRIL
jgi:hypothetical protein